MPDGSHHVDLDAFESSLDEMLERVSASAAAPAQPSPGGPGQAPVRRTRLRRRQGSVLFVLAALAGAVAWTGPWRRPPPPPALAFEQLPPPAAGVAAHPAPSIAPDAPSMPSIAADPDASTEVAMLDQLRQGMPVDGLAAPAFAIARYDTLRPASPGREVLASLGVEEVYALVPAASPLRELGDLRGRRINVGAPGSPRATSAEALYRTLFAQPLPTARWRAASRDAALPALLRGEDLDAMLVFDGQPSAWLAALPVDTRLQLKVLRFDPGSPAGLRALRTYLSTSVAPALAAEPARVPTLGQMTFLVGARPEAGAPDLVRRLCERLPALRARGHPKWKDVDPTLQLPLPLPRSSAVVPALQACATSASPSTPSSGAL